MTNTGDGVKGINTAQREMLHWIADNDSQEALLERAELTRGELNSALALVRRGLARAAGLGFRITEASRSAICSRTKGG